jgi:multidrug efflux system membrane fusion protein
VPVYLDEVGKCVAREVVSVLPQVSGAITQIHFVDGANVKKGQMLFTIDPRPFEASLQQTQANLGKDAALKNQAEANLAKDIVAAKNAAVQAHRYEELAQQQAVTKEQADEWRTNADTLEATVNADRAAVKSAEQAMAVDQANIQSAKVQLSYCYIRAPLDGRAGHRLVDLGNVVSLTNTTPLLVIERVDPIYADFTVAQNDLAAVRQNMAQRTLKVEVRLPDQQDEMRAGALTFLDNTVQDQTGTVNLRATVSNSDRHLWPGQFVKVRLVLSTQTAVLVPAAAPQTSAKGPFVYVVKEDTTAELRPVKLGQRQGDSIVVQEGLNGGEKVVVNGQLGVTPGGKVRIEGTSTQAESAPANSRGKS